MIPTLLAQYPVVVQQPVAWGDMDAYRHVNNVVYFKYWENARLTYFEKLDWRGFEKDAGVGPILQSIQARFRRPLTYPDTIWIGARLLTLEEDRFTLEHKIVSQTLGDWTTEGQAVVVAFHYALGKKVPIPDEMRRRIHELEATVARDR